MKILKIKTCSQCPHNIEVTISKVNNYMCTLMDRTLPILYNESFPKWCPLSESKNCDIKKYQYIVDESNDDYYITVIDLPGCNVRGKTLEEAITNKNVAIKSYLETECL